jgi:hypothetical protein
VDVEEGEPVTLVVRGLAMELVDGAGLVAIGPLAQLVLAPTVGTAATCLVTLAHRGPLLRLAVVVGSWSGLRSARFGSLGR